MTKADTENEDWDHTAGNAQVLLRARLEIGRILDDVAASGRLLSAALADESLVFVAPLRHVDPAGEFILVAYCDDRAANTAVLASHHVTLTGNNGRGRIEFVAPRPVHQVTGASAAIRFDFPQMLVMRQRRAHRRVRADAPLRCLADAAGIMPFAAEIVDIAPGGVGTLIYDAGITLVPGTVLKGCQIVDPGGGVVVADLEVRHSTSVALPDGRRANHSGCAFLGTAPGLEELVRLYAAGRG